MERRYRLTRNADFDRVRTQGRSWAQPLLIFSAVRNDLGYTRFGFIVSRRVGNAVVRNRVKRRLREIVRRHLSEFPPGWDMVVIARPPSAEALSADIESALMQALGRARAWLEAPGAAVKSSVAGE